MKTAIDRRFIGQEQEINITNLEWSPITGGFFCPECGEAVIPVKGRKEFFRHFKKQDNSCDLRVDGGCQDSFYERTGLPIFLKRTGSIFNLKIGFLPLGEKLLDSIQKDEIKVTVSASSFYHDYLIDYTFEGETITLKPLDFIPVNEKNYTITLSDELAQISRNWGDFADGFGKDGAIFSSMEESGRKIRRNDSITTHKQYYIMSRSGTFPDLHGLEGVYQGRIQLQQATFDIHEFIVTTSDEAYFRRIQNYISDGFKVNLLFKKPELATIWPPTSINSGIQYTCHCSTLFVRVLSTQDYPKVYGYSDSKSFNVPVISDNSGNYHPKWITRKVESLLPLTIDRKYQANSYIFSNAIPDVNFQPENILVNEQTLDAVKHLYSGEHLEIKANVHLKIVVLSALKKREEYTLDSSNGKSILLPNSGLYLEIYKNNQLIFYRELEKKGQTSNLQFDDSLLLSFRPYLNEKTIPIPRKYTSILQELEKIPNQYKIVLSALRNRQIQPSILKILERRL